MAKMTPFIRLVYDRYDSSSKLYNNLYISVNVVHKSWPQFFKNITSIWFANDLWHGASTETVICEYIEQERDLVRFQGSMKIIMRFLNILNYKISQLNEDYL